MGLSDGLRDSLKVHLGWGKCRLDCFVGMLLGLLRLKQANLTQLAVAFASEADPKSRYRRLQRFFAQVVFDYDAVARLIVYKGAAIPMCWLVLNKRGNSSQTGRIALLKRFISQFGRDGIQGMLGDREFIGEQWWQWLSANRIPFLMRMKENQLMTDQQGREMAVRSRFRDLKARQGRRLRKACEVQARVWLSGMRLEGGELLVLAANQRFREPFGTYALRWEIENLFQCLNGRGFHWEDIRLTRRFRIKKVMALLSIGFCWAHKTGEWKHKVIKPVALKKHGRPAQSLFRYGLDHRPTRCCTACKNRWRRSGCGCCFGGLLT